MKKIILPLIFLILISGCTTGKHSERVASKGDTVVIGYVGLLEDGSVFDTTSEEIARNFNIYQEGKIYSPIVFELGKGNMIEGFENAILGMKLGEEKAVSIPVEQAYGEKKEELIGETTISASMFLENNMTLVINGTYMINANNGRPLSLKVVSFNETDVNALVDFNHPLAGKELIFRIKLYEIR